MLTFSQFEKGLRAEESRKKRQAELALTKPVRTIRLRVDGALRDVVVPDGVREVTRTMRTRVRTWIERAGTGVPTVSGGVYVTEEKMGQPAPDKLAPPAEAFGAA